MKTLIENLTKAEKDKLFEIVQAYKAHGHGLSDAAKMLIFEDFFETVLKGTIGVLFFMQLGLETALAGIEKFKE